MIDTTVERYFAVERIRARMRLRGLPPRFRHIAVPRTWPAVDALKEKLLARGIEVVRWRPLLLKRVAPIAARRTP